MHPSCLHDLNPPLHKLRNLNSKNQKNQPCCASWSGERQRQETGASVSGREKKCCGDASNTTETQCKGLATQAASPDVLSATINSMGKKVVYIYI